MSKKILFEFLLNIYPISYEDFIHIEKALKIELYKKGELILDKGSIDTKIKFVVSGVVHQYYIIEDNMLTKNFALSNMLFNDFQSYVEKTPSIEVQKALTDVQILTLQKKDAERLLIENHPFSIIYSKSLSDFYLQREKRTLILQHKSAYTRFEYFMNTLDVASRYLQEIPQKRIADYLGITPETLSRVKKEYFEKIIK